MIINNTGFNSYKTAQYSEASFKSTNNPATGTSGIPDDICFTIYPNNTDNSVRNSIKQIFGNQDEGIKGVFKEAFDFLEAQYERERLPIVKTLGKLSKARSNADELAKNWEQVYKDGLAYRVFESPAGLASDTDKTAQNKMQKSIDAQKYIDAKGNLLAQICEKGDSYTKKTLFGMLTEDSPEKFDKTLDKILEASEKLVERTLSDGKSVVKITGYRINLSQISELLTNQAAPSSFVHHEIGITGKKD